MRRTFALALAGTCLAGLSLVVPASAVAAAPAAPSELAAAPAPAPPTPTYLWTLIGKTTNDPAVNYYYKTCGLRPGHNIDCLSQGFELDVTATKTPAVFVVYQVVLYSNRNTGFAQYPGKLPFDFTWATTAGGVVNKLGNPSQKSGGYGTDITYIYYSSDGYKVSIEFVARHERYFTSNTLIHDIKISRYK